MKKSNKAPETKFEKGQELEIVKFGTTHKVRFMGLTSCHGKMFYRFERISDKLTMHLIIPELSANPEKNAANLSPVKKTKSVKKSKKTVVETEVPVETPTEEISE